MIKNAVVIVVVGFTAVLIHISRADAGWFETWNNYSGSASGVALPAGDWTIHSAAAPLIKSNIALAEPFGPPRALDGPANVEGQSILGTIFREVDPNDRSVKFSWWRNKGNTVPRTLEIGMYTSDDPNSARVTLFFDARDFDNLVEVPPEHFASSSGGGSFSTTIPLNGDGWFDGIIRLLPSGTHALVGWRPNGSSGPYTTSTLALPAGFEFNYVGINKFGSSGGTAGPGSRVENIEVVPEPTSAALMILALISLFGFVGRGRG